MDIYKRKIIDHYKNPRNKGKLANADAEVYEVNTLCGDALKFYIKFDQEGKIQKVSFEGEGCALSQATASMLTEKITGMTVKKLLSVVNLAFVKKLLGIEINPGRLKCVMLPIECFKKLQDGKYGQGLS